MIIILYNQWDDQIYQKFYLGLTLYDSCQPYTQSKFTEAWKSRNHHNNFPGSHHLWIPVPVILDSTFASSSYKDRKDQWVLTHSRTKLKSIMLPDCYGYFLLAAPDLHTPLLSPVLTLSHTQALWAHGFVSALLPMASLVSTAMPVDLTLKKCLI